MSTRLVRSAGIIVMLGAALSACGGRSTPKPPPPPPEEEIVHIGVRKPDKEPEPPPPPPPQEWYAHAELAPVKGAKLKRGVVKLSQTEGQGMSLTSAFDGLKPGHYHFVIHQGTECGKNAGKAGPALEAAAVALPVEIAKKPAGPIEMVDLALMLDGDSTIVGHALVLHADKKGKPHKAVGCGVIIADEPAAEEPDDESGGDDSDDDSGDEL
jgi:hypothetical protein